MLYKSTFYLLTNLLKVSYCLHFSVAKDTVDLLWVFDVIVLRETCRCQQGWWIDSIRRLVLRWAPSVNLTASFTVLRTTIEQKFVNQTCRQRLRSCSKYGSQLTVRVLGFVLFTIFLTPCSIWSQKSNCIIISRRRHWKQFRLLVSILPFRGLSVCDLTASKKEVIRDTVISLLC